MTWKAGTIRYDAACAIFTDVTFERVEINGEAVAYKATLDGAEYHDRYLTPLCKRLWQLQRAQEVAK